jgi:NADH-quinone oxidoreductase subunit M
VLSLILFTPIAGAVALLFIDRRREDVVRGVANGCAIGTFLLALPLWFQFEPFGAAWQFVQREPWIPAIGANYYVAVDGVSTLLVLLTTLVTAVAVAASWPPITDRLKEYYVFLLILESGLIGTFVSIDFLLFFVFWEITLVPMYFLIGIWGRGRAFHAGLKFVLYALIGSVVMLFGIFGLYFFNHSATGVYTFDITQFQQLSIPFETQKWIFVSLLVGFAVRIPIFPLHSWLPDAHTEAPTSGTIMMTALGLKMGLYGLIRFSLPILPDATRHFVPWIAAFSLIGVLYTGLVALVERDLKRLIAYSSLSQIGLMTIGVFALTPVSITGSVVQQINHAISVAGLLLVAGVVFDRRRTLEISELGGLAKITPVLSAIFLLLILSSIGMPALNGFIGQFLILQGLYVAHKSWAAIAAGGMVLGAVCMLWLYQRTMWGPVDNPSNTQLRDLNVREIAAFVPLVALVIWIGVYPEPFLRRLQSSVGRVVVRVSPEYGPAIAKAEAECNKPAAPPVTVPGAPAGLIVDAPCADGSTPAVPKPSSPTK